MPRTPPSRTGAAVRREETVDQGCKNGPVGAGRGEGTAAGRRRRPRGAPGELAEEAVDVGHGSVTPRRRHSCLRSFLNRVLIWSTFVAGRPAASCHLRRLQVVPEGQPDGLRVHRVSARRPARPGRSRSSRPARAAAPHRGLPQGVRRCVVLANVLGRRGLLALQGPALCRPPEGDALAIDGRAPPVHPLADRPSLEPELQGGAAHALEHPLGDDSAWWARCSGMRIATLWRMRRSCLKSSMCIASLAWSSCRGCLRVANVLDQAELVHLVQLGLGPARGSADGVRVGRSSPGARPNVPSPAPNAQRPAGQVWRLRWASLGRSHSRIGTDASDVHRRPTRRAGAELHSLTCREA